MNTSVSARTPDIWSKNYIPPLENGDRLTRDEFHRRYEAMPENVKAELINGIVYMASPTKADKHGKPHGLMMAVLGQYLLATSGLELLDNVTYVASPSYEPQPDIVLRINESRGGGSQINDDGYLEGTPELIVEIASTSVSYDLHDKLEIYERKGVQEYIVWRVLDEQIDWFFLSEGSYKRFLDKNGVIESKVFPGLRLNIRAIINDDTKTVIEDLRIGMAGRKYAAFAKKLEKTGSKL